MTTTRKIIVLLAAILILATAVYAYDVTWKYAPLQVNEILAVSCPLGTDAVAWKNYYVDAPHSIMVACVPPEKDEPAPIPNVSFLPMVVN
jgi:hypothetical protein